MTIMKIVKSIKFIYFADYPHVHIATVVPLYKNFYKAIYMKNEHKHGRSLPALSP